MAAYLTLIDGSKWFPYGIDRESNRIYPTQWQAQMYLCKHSGHISVDPLHKNFGRTKEFPPDLKPYYLAESSLRLLQLLEKDLKSKGEKLNTDENLDLRLEALIFSCHKIYPPGDKYSPELSEKSQSNFDTHHIQKNRRMIKANSIMVRKALGLQVRVSEILIELNKQLQSNELYYLQHKSDDELKLMNLPPHGVLYSLKNGKEIPKLFPLNSEELTSLWWSKFIELGGWECFDEEKHENEFRKENMDFNNDLEENGFRD